MSDFDVPVKTWIPVTAYRQLERLAKEHETTVAVLVAWAATNSLKPRPKPKRKYVRMTPELLERLRYLLTTEMSRAEIAEVLGVSRGTIENHVHRARNQI